MIAPMIETPRLALRPLSLEDAGFILELLNDADFLRYIGDKGVRTRQDAEGYIRSGPMDSHARLGFGLDCVELQGGSEPIGLCGLLKREWLEHVDLGFAFLPRFRGHGYAVEAGAAVLAWARQHVAPRRVLAITTPDNAASIAVLGKLGFRAEGRVQPPGEDIDLRLFAADV